MSIIVDKEFESLIPPLTAEEFQQLEENCIKEGIRDDLIVWPQGDGNSILIDGHNRFRISAKHAGIIFNVKQINFANRNQAIAWICRNQLGRRNLHELDKEHLMDVCRKAETNAAKERHGYRTDLHGDFVEKFPQSGKTRDIIGEKIGVSGRQVDKLHAINEKASERTKQLVREGKLSVNQAYNSVHPKRPDPVKQAKQEHKEYAEKKADSVIDFKAAQIDQINQQIINNDLYQSVVKLLGSIEDFGILYKREELDKALEGIGKEEQERLINKCDTSISIIRIIIESLGGIRWRK